MKKENLLTQRSIPPIGLRIIKSGIAVALCFCIAYFRGNEGIVFYSLLSALWCIQVYRTNTRKNAIQRFSGTVIGALYGLLFLLVLERIGIAKPEWVEQESAFFFLQAVMVSVLTILVLYTTVLVHKKQASYFSCVVFLSIVVNHITDVNPYFFVWNRFLDTCIGIAVGIFVNDFSLPLKRKKDILFISGLDGTLLNENSNLTDYSKVELNRMLDEGLQFTISTMRTPASLMEPVRDIHLNLPVIAMDGAVLYDMKEKMYKKVYVISADTSQKIMDVIRKAGMQCFVNIIVDDMLVIYYSESEDPVYRNLVTTLRRSPFRNYVKRIPPKEEDVVYFMLLDKKDRMERFYEQLIQKGWQQELKILKYDSRQYSGYSYIKIYNKNASKKHMMEYLKQMTNMENTITFGTIPGQYDVLVKEGDSNQVVHRMKRYFEYGIRPE